MQIKLFYLSFELKERKIGLKGENWVFETMVAKDLSNQNQNICKKSKT